jgi:hypothetical protein
MIDNHWDKCEICKEEIIGKSHKVRFFRWSQKHIACESCHRCERMTNQMGRTAGKFWDEYRKTHTGLPHICDFSIEELKRKHKNVLSLCDKYDTYSIGILIAGECYKDVWSSRACSGHLASLMGYGDNAYMEYYCSSSNYYFMCSCDSQMMKDFQIAMKLDNEYEGKV